MTIGSIVAAGPRGFCIPNWVAAARLTGPSCLGKLYKPKEFRVIHMNFDLTVAGSLASVLGLVIPIAIILRNRFKGKNKQMKEICAENRLNKINEILSRPHRFDLNIKETVNIFMPNGELIFGAGWINLEWAELLNNFIEKNEHLKMAPRYFVWVTKIIGSDEGHAEHAPAKLSMPSPSGAPVGRDIDIFAAAC